MDQIKRRLKQTSTWTGLFTILASLFAGPITTPAVAAALASGVGLVLVDA